MRQWVSDNIFWALGGCVLVLAYFCYLGGWDSRSIFGDIGDGFFNNFVLEHGYYWVSGRIQNFWDGLFFYPVKNVLAFSDNHLGTLLAYSFSRSLGFSPETSYQHWMLLISLLNFLSAFVVSRKFGISKPVAVVVALLFTFALPVAHKLVHIQLFPRFCVPFLFYFCYQFIKVNNVHYAGLAVAAFAVQMLCGVYVGFFSVIIVGVFFVILFVGKKNKAELIVRRRRDYLLLMGYCLPSLLVLGLVFYRYYLVSKEYGNRSWDNVLSMTPSIETWFYTKGSLLYPFLSDVGSELPMRHEHLAFMGFAPLMMIPVALCFLLFLKKNKGQCEIIIACVFTVIVCLILYTQYQGMTLYYLIYQLPGLSAIRAVSRVGIVLIFPLLILLGIFLTKLQIKGRDSLVAKMLFLAACPFVLAEQIVVPGTVSFYDKDESRDIRTQVVPLIPKDADAFFYFPLNYYPFYTNHIAAMFASLETQVPTLNGYSGNFPSHFGPLLNFNAPGDLEYVFKDLGEEFPDLDNVYLIGFEERKINLRAFEGKEFSGNDRPLENYSYEVEFPESSIYCEIEKTVIHIKIVNKTKETFRSHYSGEYGLALSYRVSPSIEWEERIFLPHDIPPGEFANVSLVVDGLAEGVNVIQFSMVQELVAWFHDRNQKVYETIIIRK